ncbi:GPI mannosyltransferase 2 [Xylariomycetidae sp. FL2044]|nr:GPI mannosyltransferase 2 [Xylariomycetidae sp. FL2044]
MPHPVIKRTPRWSLTGAFFAWKTFLLAVAMGSAVAPPYDTSTTLISPDATSFHEPVSALATRLTRWDAIYFIESARRGYLFEQEWAFGRGLPTVISFLAKLLPGSGKGDVDSLMPAVGVFVAHSAHLLSVLVLYQLGMVISKSPQRAFVAALLHVISPAGLFLSAPYSESSFALLSFMGYLFFARGVASGKRTLAHDISLVASGMWLGFSMTFRSNGLLNGLLFAVELVRELSSPPTLASIRRRLALIIGGSAIAVGFAIPQFIAYQTYCVGGAVESRPWCSKMPPSIYSFVQEHYWNVGFLRYWTPSNIPLFCLAAPMIYILIRSGLQFLRNPHSMPLAIDGQREVQASSGLTTLIQSMASIQLVLTVLAVTSYHIQIITRISSGYPLWYLWLAGTLGNAKTASFGSKVVMFMVMYASIQGALFASFLPPA